MAFLRDSSLYCITNFTYTDQEKSVIGGICMFTSTFGFLGAALQIKSLWQYRNRQRRRPSPNPNIIFYLALSDLMACIGVFALAICFLTLKPPRRAYTSDVQYIPGPDSEHQKLYEPIITILEVVTLFSYLASYIWTVSYSLDMYFQIIKIECPIIVYHIIAWLFPLDIVAVVEGINFGIYTTGRCQTKLGQMSRLCLSYFLVLVVIIGNPVLLWLTYKKIKKLLRFTGVYTDVDRTVLTRFKRKFLLMVFVFMICWLPNIVSVFYDIVKMSTLPRHDQYVPNYKKKHELEWPMWRMAFVYIEAFFNPLQGMFDYLIYRNAFKVMATDIRSHNCLPRVTSNESWFEVLNDDCVQNGGATKQTVKETGNSSGSYGEKTQTLSSNSYSYIPRLLGE